MKLKTNNNRIMALFLSVLLVFALIPLNAFASIDAQSALFVDMPDNWATQALLKAVDNGLLNGYNEDGKNYIKPDGILRKNEVMAIITRAFGVTSVDELNGVKDVPSTAWYAESIGKAVQMGIISLRTRMMPELTVTREIAFATLAKAFKLKTINGDYNSLDHFSDKTSISAELLGELNALVKEGYLQGYPDGTLKPKASISRAEFATIMDRMIATYISKAGIITQVPARGNVLIRTTGVTLKDVIINGDLIIADGVGDGEATLDSVRVEGRLVVRGGGVNSIIIKGSSSIDKIIVSRIDNEVRIAVEGDANVEYIYIDDGSDDVIITGNVGSVEITGDDIVVTATDATIGNMTISGDNANLVVNKDSKIGSIDISGKSSRISGEGEVINVNVKDGGSNASITTTNTKIDVKEGATGVTGKGLSIIGGTTYSNDSPWTVIFKDWDGSFLKADTVKNGEDAIPPEDPYVLGNTFTGWGTPFINITSDLSVFAEYEINKYTVSFDSNGRIAVTPILDVPYNTSLSSIPTETSNGNLALAGWFTNNAFTVRLTEETKITEDTTFYAKWVTPLNIIFSKNTYAILLGGNEILIAASTNPEHALIKNATWESDDPDIATVNSNGTVTGLSLGYAFITASIPDGLGDYFYAECMVIIYEESTEDDFLFNSSTGTITGYHGTGGNVIIPSTISGVAVTGIDDGAFQECYDIVNITIPNSITIIGIEAFKDTSLSSINVDAGNVSFSSIEGVLYNKEQTTLLVYPSDKSESDFEIPAGVITINDYAFYEAYGLNSITISNGVTNIASCAFEKMHSLTAINVDPGNVSFSSIEGVLYNKEQTILLFYPGYKSGSDFEIPATVITINDYAFHNYYYLRSITISNNVTNIGSSAFEEMNFLTAINVDPGNVSFSSIDGVLYNKAQTTLLKYPIAKPELNFEIPAGVIAIADFAFKGNRYLASVTIPNTVTSIGLDAFLDCSVLEAINVDAGNLNYSSVHGILYDKNITTLISVPVLKNDVGTFVIPNTVITIADFAFKGQRYLASVTIPNTVTSIGVQAFSTSNSNFNEVIFGLESELTTIGDYAFTKNYYLSSIELPDSVTSLGEGVFQDSGLISILIGTGVAVGQHLLSSENDGFREAYLLGGAGTYHLIDEVWEWSLGD